MTSIEKSILGEIIDSNECLSRTELIEKLDFLSVSTREKTGVGLFINFQDPEKHICALPDGYYSGNKRDCQRNYLRFGCFR